MPQKNEFRDIINIATGKESLKVEPTAETMQLIKTSTMILGGALTFLAISLLIRKK